MPAGLQRRLRAWQALPSPAHVLRKLTAASCCCSLPVADAACGFDLILDANAQVERLVAGTSERATGANRTVRQLLLGAELLQVWGEFSDAAAGAEGGQRTAAEVAAAERLQPVLARLNECWKSGSTADVIGNLAQVGGWAAADARVAKVAG